ncbi:MAG: sulfotransferase, partial [Proteobacteria bacterium]|nr:sulfotransferase [Pseudomonadota bacterium]
MEELVEHPEIPDAERTQLCNALGLEHEGRNDFDKAFECFDQCNSVRRGKEYYDPAQTEMQHDDAIEVFDHDFVRQPPADVIYDATPIFIVGLPRSGSTLLEQILASHPLVEGTHELSDLSRVVNQIPKLVNTRGRYPLDNCLGSFKQLFAKGQTFTYDLTELGEYYLEYCRMIDHWHDVLPAKVLDVHYEDVVDDLEVQVRCNFAAGNEFGRHCPDYRATRCLVFLNDRLH